MERPSDRGRQWPGSRRYRTKTEIAYETVKEAILSGALAPGRHLTIATLAEELQMSEIPIREALQRLSREGLVSLVPHLGATVSDLPLEGVRENLIIRAELEGLAAEIAVGHVTEEALRELEELITMMDECIESGNFAEYGKLNRNFHFAIYDLIPYRRLVGLIEDLWNQVPQARSVFVLVPDYAVQSQKGHKQIVAALRARDGALARRLVREQKLRAAEAIARRLQS